MSRLQKYRAGMIAAEKIKNHKESQPYFKTNKKEAPLDVKRQCQQAYKSAK